MYEILKDLNLAVAKIDHVPNCQIFRLYAVYIMCDHALHSNERYRVVKRTSAFSIVENLHHELVTYSTETLLTTLKINDLDGIFHSLFQLSSYLNKFTVIEELIETLPGGRVAMKGVVQPVRENSPTALFVIFSLSPHLKLLSGNHQITNFSPPVDDRLFQPELLHLSFLILPSDHGQIAGIGLGWVS